MSLKPSMNWLFAFIPVAVVLDLVGGISPPVLFFTAALAIVPIAGLIVRATEQIAMRTGDAIGGLLNATFGNAPELIIAIVALKAGYVDMVRASLAGAILANMLLALGAAFIAGGLKHRDQQFNPVSLRAYSTMMFMAVFSLAIPSAFSREVSPNGESAAEEMLNIGIAGTLLLLYGLYLVYSLKTHSKAFASVGEGDEPEHEGKQWSMALAIGSLIGASVLAAFVSEILVGAAEGTGKALGMSETFIGIIFLAIVGGAAESFSAVAMARKNKVDLTVGIVLGSSIQISLFVAPVLVFASYFVGPAPMELAFARAEIWAIFIAALIGTTVCGDGNSNWFKGAQLIAIYVMIGLMYYFLPARGH